ncbi:MAG: oligosaccharide flippase family protein [Firmicutes bacterium]|nr:oligosaccharide flippase family protein [Bacillota bacterium]
MKLGSAQARNLRPNLRNFFYLVISGLTIQLAGSVYRLWLANRIGAEGLGILQMVYPVYRLLSGLATLGLPLALTKWSAEYLAAGRFLEVKSLIKWAVRLVSVSSMITGLALFCFAPSLGQFVFTDGRVTEALYMIALAIPFSALSAVYRGYFQGHLRMAPLAASELTEQTVEIGFTFFLLSCFFNQLPFSHGTTPVLGLTLGEVTCLVTLLCFRKNAPPNALAQAPPISVPALPRREVLQYSWPLLLNQIISSVSMASEGIIIPRLLMAGGIPAAVSTGLFGQLTGMAEPVSYFPLILLAPLASVLSPQVSSALQIGALGRMKKKIRLFYMVTLILCLACFLGIMSLAGPISLILYGSAASAPLIRLLVIGLPFTGIAILNISILGAAGATAKILLISVWAMGLKAFCFAVLIPLEGITGAAWAINITQIFLALESMVELRRKLPAPGA